MDSPPHSPNNVFNFLAVEEEFEEEPEEEPKEEEEEFEEDPDGGDEEEEEIVNPATPRQSAPIIHQSPPKRIFEVGGTSN
nr:hypothetical protein [Tanacetum cinerariifolium]